MSTFAWQLLRQANTGEYEMILKERRAWLASVDIQNNPRLLAEWMALIQELDRVARESLGVDSQGFSSQPYDDDEGRLHGRARSRSLHGTSFARSVFGNSNAANTEGANGGGARQRSRSFMGFLGAFVSRTIGGAKKGNNVKRDTRGNTGGVGNISRTTSQPFPVRGGAAGGTPNGRSNVMRSGSGNQEPIVALPAGAQSNRNDKLRFALAMHKQQSIIPNGTMPNGGVTAGAHGQSAANMTRDAARAMALARFSQEGGRASSQTTANTADASYSVSRGPMDHGGARASPNHGGVSPIVPAVLDIPEVRHVVLGLRDERTDALCNSAEAEGNAARALSWV